MIITWALVQKQWNTSATGEIHPNPSISSNCQAPVCTRQSFSWLISMWKVQRDIWASFPLNCQRLVMHCSALPWNDPAICWSSISKDKGWLPVLFFQRQNESCPCWMCAMGHNTHGQSRVNYPLSLSHSGETDLCSRCWKQSPDDPSMEIPQTGM